MRNLLNPKWLLFVNTLPIVLLFLLYGGQYNIIKSLLKDENLLLWKQFGWTLFGLGSLNFLYAFFLIVKKKMVSAWYGVIALLLYIPFLYLYCYHADKIIPFSIPNWMVPEGMFIYVGTFLMPTLIYSLFVMVAGLTRVENSPKAWLNFLLAIIVPVAWYLFSQLILPLWKPVEQDFWIHIMVIFVILGTILFLFFVIRGIYILALKATGSWRKYQLTWKIPISLVFPLVGLLLNNGYLFKKKYSFNESVFGDFDNPWFYILAILNGIFICLPNLEHKIYRLFLFIARSITFAYTFYFFMVFLPFLPLSVIAIVGFGLGFLMLTPLILFVIHVNELSADLNFLKTRLPKRVPLVISLLGFMVIPICITGSYLNHKKVLHQSLDYVYSPDFSKNEKINTSSLQKTLNVIKYHKKNHNNSIMGTQIPYLSPYFNWLVLDNLMLSDDKINDMEKIFFGGWRNRQFSEPEGNMYVGITKINSTSTYNSQQKTWSSWINMEITNTDENAGFGEYTTIIDLPAGCWISDYYLVVNGKKEMGLLAEKKSAVWVFSQIRNENRDPGILYYLSGNRVAFRVFPFNAGETRTTGIELVHKEPLQLMIDTNLVNLGDSTHNNNLTFAESDDKNVVYVSAKGKQTLPKIKRTPYYHFLVDVSIHAEKSKEDFTHRIDNLLNQHLIEKENAKISFVNTYVSTYPMDGNWKELYNQQKFKGGYFLDLGIRKALYDSYHNLSSTYPIIVVVTENMTHGFINKDFADLKMTYPESDLFYDLDSSGILLPHSLRHEPFIICKDSVNLNFAKSVLAFPDATNPVAYIPDDDQPSVILKKEILKGNEINVSDKSWSSALAMQGNWMSQNLHPELSDAEWFELVKNSFRSKVMMPVTSYIVVENEAQRNVLKKKQEQVLSSKKSLDIGEDTQRMSEPGLVIVVLLVGAFIFYRERKRIRKGKNHV